MFRESDEVELELQAICMREVRSMPILVVAVIEGPLLVPLLRHGSGKSPPLRLSRHRGQYCSYSFFCAESQQAEKYSNENVSAKIFSFT